VARFLIEVPHEAEKIACLRSIQVFLSSGSHFLTHADWGCMDGVHSAWMVVDVANKNEALNIVPPAFRKDARVTSLGTWVLSDIETMLAKHVGAPNQP
jgi:hypothetical protein